MAGMTRVKIALDARRLARTSLEGIGQYVLHLAARLPQLAPEIEFLLLANHPLRLDRVPNGCRQVVLGCSLPEGGAGAKAYSPFWMNFHVARFLARGGADLFHGTNYALPVFACCRYVATIHDVAFTRVPRTFSPIHRAYLRSQVSLSIRRADQVIVGSGAARADLVRMTGVDLDRMMVIHHGVDEGYSVCNDRDYLDGVRRRFALPERYVLHVGVVEVKKNIEALLRASAPLVREGVVDGIVLAGRDGRRADGIRRLAAELGLDGRALFLGHVPQDTMRGLYSLARVFVFPSWFEGFGLPVLEAMACGTPVISSDSSSLPEVAGGAAVLFPPNQPDKLESELRRVLSDPQLRADLIGRGLARASEFSWAASAARHLEVYRRVLQASGNAV